MCIQPTISCPENINQNNDAGFCKALVNYKVNTCTPALSYTFSGASTGSGTGIGSGSQFSVGITTVTLTAANTCGLNKCTFNIIIKDVESPKIICPNDQNRQTPDGMCNYFIKGLELNPTATDNCSIQQIYYSLSGATVGNGTSSLNNLPINLGITKINWNTIDVGGKTGNGSNSNGCSFNITVTPFTCGKPNQISALEITKSSAKIKWLNGLCGNSYQLRNQKEIQPGVYGAWSTWVNPIGPGLQHVFTNLTSNTKYQYQVITKCGTAFSEATTGSFMTLKSFGPNEDQKRNSEHDTTVNNFHIPTIKLIPNPTSDITAIYLEGFRETLKNVSLLDLYGRAVFAKLIEPHQNLLELDVKALGLQDGIYLVQIKDENYKITEKLVIAK
ncbi:MAG: T9SS type A sorting domain-containing protein [Saprospiraceae bacterium]|nr:T9SS type A sorting domain-containing protein [Saprospiraceae bacterium]